MKLLLLCCLLLAGCSPAAPFTENEFDRTTRQPIQDVRFDVIPTNWDDAGLLISC